MDKQLDQVINTINKTAFATNFSGVVSIFKDSRAILHKAFGYRDIKNQLLNQTDTVFGTASGTKLFTALGIGALIDLGELTLDTTVGDISQEYRGFINERATIQQLLSHTSGIFDYYDEEIDRDFDNFKTEIPWCELETPKDYWPIFKDKKMKFKPGERFSYSNGGFVFLGMIIEKISGQLYRDFISETVLKPAGMTHSGFFAGNDLPRNTAIGYLEDRCRTNIFQLPIRGAGDGGMYTTSGDLNSFWQSLFSYQIISRNLLSEYLKTQWKFDERRGYGLGIYKRLDDSMFYIVGGDAGVGFDSRYLPGQRITVNILSNITNGEEEIRSTIMESMDEVLKGNLR